MYSYALADEAAVEVGGTIIFGSYEQDNNPDNGPEPIEWIVLDVQEGKALLISRFALDEKKYNEDWEDVTWETSTLRAWLNDEFISIAFSEEERSAILLSSVDNSDSQGYSYNTTGGNDTEDRIFLLSYYEAFEQYFSDNEARMCAPTDYAIANGANPDEEYQAEGRNTCPWFLRSPQKDYQQFAMAVDSDGSRFFLNAGHLSVRPAFWLDLNVHNSSGEK